MRRSWALLVGAAVCGAMMSAPAGADEPFKSPGF
jgi:hypothetical protein